MAEMVIGEKVSLEEMGGARGVLHYMQRTAVQGSPSVLTAITREWSKGATETTDTVHPFRKTFDQLEIGDTLVTGTRTITPLASSSGMLRRNSCARGGVSLTLAPDAGSLRLRSSPTPQPHRSHACRRSRRTSSTLPTTST